MDKFKNKNRGFTIIELVVVMIIIGILVLLATPRFIKYIREARYTNIINDIRTVETVSIPVMTKTNNFPNGTSSLSIRDISQMILGRKAYVKDGYITQNKEDNYIPEVGKVSELYGDDLSNYYLLDKKSFVKAETRTRLKGDFLINKNGDVIYVDDEEFAENAFDISNMYLYDESNPGKIIGMNEQNPLWDSVNRKENERYNPDFEGLSYEEVDWDQVVSEEDFQEYKDVYEEKGMTIEDIRRRIYGLASRKECLEFPGIPSSRKLKNGGRVEINEIEDKAFINIPFYGEFNGEKLKKIGKLAFLNSSFTGSFAQEELEYVGEVAFGGSNFTGEFIAPKLKKIPYGTFENSKFTGSFNAPNLEELGDFAFGRSEFSGEFNAANLRQIGEYNFYLSNFTGDFNTNIKYISKGAMGDLDVSKFNGSFNAPNLLVVHDDVFRNARFKENFNAAEVINIADNAFRNSNFTGNINMDKVIFIGKYAFENSKFTGNFNAMNKSFITFKEVMDYLIEMNSYILDDDKLPMDMREVYEANLSYLLSLTDEEIESENESYNENGLTSIGEFSFRNSEFTGDFLSKGVHVIKWNSFENSNFMGEFNAPTIKIIYPNAFGNTREFSSYYPNIPGIIEAIESGKGWDISENIDSIRNYK